MVIPFTDIYSRQKAKKILMESQAEIDISGNVTAFAMKFEIFCLHEINIERKSYLGAK